MFCFVFVIFVLFFFSVCNWIPILCALHSLCGIAKAAFGSLVHTRIFILNFLLRARPFTKDMVIRNERRCLCRVYGFHVEVFIMKPLWPSPPEIGFEQICGKHGSGCAICYRDAKHVVVYCQGFQPCTLLMMSISEVLIKATNRLSSRAPQSFKCGRDYCLSGATRLMQSYVENICRWSCFHSVNPIFAIRGVLVP